MKITRVVAFSYLENNHKKCSKKYSYPQGYLKLVRFISVDSAISFPANFLYDSQGSTGIFHAEDLNNIEMARAYLIVLMMFSCLLHDLDQKRPEHLFESHSNESEQEY